MAESSRKLETYLFQYRALGKTWCLDIPAYSLEEAKHRIASISDTAKYDGILHANIPAGPNPVSMGLILTATCWLKNSIRKLRARSSIAPHLGQ